MQEQIIPLVLAKERVRLHLRCGVGLDMFRGFLDPDPSAPGRTVKVPQEQIVSRRAAYPAEYTDALVEFNEIPGCVSSAILDRGCCLFHGAAFLWRGRAYIFTAPSGTGKSTQYVLWKELLGDGIRIINGDKPLLRLESDGTVWVHPSPWKGKEHMGSMCSGPLGGIFLLEQGSANAVAALKPAQSAVPLFCQFLFDAGTAESVHQVCRLESRILETVPVWRLVNRGDADSARLGMETIIRYEEVHR